MSTGYRIQNAGHDATDLLDPEQQVSYHYSGDDDLTRRGVSVCDSIEALAEYIAQTGIEIDPHHSVIVKVDGYHSDDEPVDAELGESLLIPTAVVEVIDPDAVGFYDLVSEAFDRIYA